jgi:hypothetical protein
MTTKKKTPFSRLPIEVKNAIELVQDRKFGFDRLHVWIDHPDPDIPESMLAPLCGKVEIRRGRSKQYQNFWQTEICLFQPSVKCLQCLNELVGTRYRTKISYLEFAADLITRDRNDARALQQFFLAHVVVPYSRHRVNFEKETAYYNPRSSASGGRNPRVFVMYADKKSKLFNADTQGRSCCHLEYRLSEPAAIGTVGIFTIADCAAFKHLRFWRRHLQLWEFEKTELGRLIGESPNVTGTALRQRSNAFLQTHEHDGNYVLQNCIRTLPKMKEILQPIDNRHFFVPRQQS